MKFAILFISIISIFYSCNTNGKQADKNNQVKFDKTKWQLKEDDAYPYRNEMLDDLIKNVTLKGLKKVEVLDLLGPPTRVDADYLFYTIDQPKIGIVTLSNKSLVIKLTKDSTVEWRKIHE
jgi:hypothetical protein